MNRRGISPVCEQPTTRTGKREPGGSDRHGQATAAEGRTARRPVIRAVTVAAIGSALFAAVVVAAVVVTPSTASAGVEASTAVITGAGRSTPLTSGTRATPYGIALPSGAGCPGDSAHHGYHVFSYLVPAGVSPASLSFKTGAADKYYGYIAQGAEFDAFNTAEGTGQVVDLPAAFTWDRLTPHDLFVPGTSSSEWEGGLACADAHGTVTNYWNTGIRFTSDQSASGGFTWRVLDPPEAPVFTLAHVGAVLIVLAVVFGVVAAVLARRRRGDGSPPETAPTAPPVGAGASR
jgi:hypothetical protein